MKISRKLITGLAIVGVLFSNVASAENSATTESSTVNVAKESLEQAKRANEAAAEAAVETVLADTRLDLDIRLIGPTSVKIASDR
jgi:outer membrane receptor for ferric coprogen and ferric-rhodotorulic acid